jgi:hypothetical protein
VGNWVGRSSPALAFWFCHRRSVRNRALEKAWHRLAAGQK